MANFLRKNMYDKNNLNWISATLIFTHTQPFPIHFKFNTEKAMLLNIYEIPFVYFLRKKYILKEKFGIQNLKNWWIGKKLRSRNKTGIISLYLERYKFILESLQWCFWLAD